MKSIFKNIAIAIAVIYQRITGKNNEVVVKLPENIAITVDEVDKCLSVVNTIKDIVNNGAVVLITEITPIYWDDLLREKLSDATLAIAAALTYSKQALTSTDKSATLNDLLAKVRFSADDDKNNFYHSLAIRLIMIASDGKVTWSEAASFIEIYFKQFFNPIKTN